MRFPRQSPRTLLSLLFVLALLAVPSLAAAQIRPIEGDPGGGEGGGFGCPLDETFFFVAQQYRDFLNREPTSWELADGAGPINSCLFRGDFACADRQRVLFSRSFWDHPEFRQQSMTFGLGLVDAYPQLYDHWDFIALSYVVYLRRWFSDPPDNGSAGFDFWKASLDNCTAPFVAAGQPQIGGSTVSQCYNDIVRAFLVSTEYRTRFGC